MRTHSPLWLLPLWACGAAAPPAPDAQLLARLDLLEARTAALPCASGEQVRSQPDGVLVCVAPEATFDPAALADGNPRSAPVTWDDLEGVPADLLDGDADSFAGVSCPEGQLMVSRGHDQWACQPRLDVADFAAATTRCKAPAMMVGLQDGQAVCSESLAVDSLTVTDPDLLGFTWTLLETSGGPDDFQLYVEGQVHARQWSVGTQDVHADHIAQSLGYATLASGHRDLVVYPTLPSGQVPAFVEVAGTMAVREAAGDRRVPFRVMAAFDPVPGQKARIRNSWSAYPDLPAPTLTAEFFCFDERNDVVWHGQGAGGCAGVLGVWGVWARLPAPATPLLEGEELHIAFEVHVISASPGLADWRVGLTRE